MNDTPPEPKATEPSDAELQRLWDEAPGEVIEANRALYNAGRASRDPEVEALKAELADWNAAVGADGDTPFDKLKLAIQHDVATKQELRNLKAARPVCRASQTAMMRAELAARTTPASPEKEKP